MDRLYLHKYITQILNFKKKNQKLDRYILKKGLKKIIYRYLHSIILMHVDN